MQEGKRNAQGLYIAENMTDSAKLLVGMARALLWTSKEERLFEKSSAITVYRNLSIPGASGPKGGLAREGCDFDKLEKALK